LVSASRIRSSSVAPESFSYTAPLCDRKREVFATRLVVFLHILVDAPRNLLVLRWRTIDGEHCELITTEPGHDVRLAEYPRQDLSGGPDRLVTCLVTIRIIGVFETVHVHEHEEHFLRHPLDSFDIPRCTNRFDRKT
jgi:hypothetical protein